jgi:hypothetical protein
MPTQTQDDNYRVANDPVSADAVGIALAKRTITLSDEDPFNLDLLHGHLPGEGRQILKIFYIRKRPILLLLRQSTCLV